MARTKQTATKLRRRDPCNYIFLDHSQKPYTVVGGDVRAMKPGIIKKLGIHLYFLGDLDVDQRVEIATRLLRSQAIEGWGNACNYWPRIDVYTPMATIEDCMEHHRQEKIYRKGAVEEMHEAAATAAREACGPEADEEHREEAAQEVILALRGKQVYPHIVPTWCCSAKFWYDYLHHKGARYRSFILVVPADCSSWDDVLQKGIIHVMFDQDVSPIMETEMMPAWDNDEEECLLESDRTGYIWVDKVDWGPPLCIERLTVGEIRNDAVYADAYGDTKDPGPIRGHLHSRWSQYTGQLWDCTYRPNVCGACDEDRPHEDCEHELNGHIFDEDGQCMECRRDLEYRRRSKRLSKKRKRERTTS